MDGQRKHRDALQAEAARFLQRYFTGGSPWELTEPCRGTTSCLFFARPDRSTKPAFVARAFVHRKRWARYRENLLYLEKHGIPAPRIQRTVSFWNSLLPRRGWVIIEEFLDGPLVCDVQPSTALAEDLGRSLAIMHAVTHSWFGWRQQVYSAATFNERCCGLLSRRFGKLQSDLAQAGTRIPAGVEASAQQLERALKQWRFAGPFVLAHGMLGGDDMIWLREKKQVAFIDLGAIRFNHRHFDLLVLRQWLEEHSGRDVSVVRAFTDSYWSGTGEEHRAASDREEPLIGGVLDIMRMQTRARQLAQSPERSAELLAAIEEIGKRFCSRTFGS